MPIITYLKCMKQKLIELQGEIETQLQLEISTTLSQQLIEQVDRKLVRM